jgi:hypothetical protein
VEERSVQGAKQRESGHETESDEEVEEQRGEIRQAAMRTRQLLCSALVAASAAAVAAEAHEAANVISVRGSAELVDASEAANWTLLAASSSAGD